LRILGAWLVLIALLGIPLEPVVAEPRLALVIGNGAYSTAPLRNAVNDARTVDRALRSVGFEVIRIENATKQQMERGIRQLAERLTPATVSLVYYAGHGIR